MGMMPTEVHSNGRGDVDAYFYKSIGLGLLREIKMIRAEVQMTLFCRRTDSEVQKETFSVVK